MATKLNEYTISEAYCVCEKIRGVLTGFIEDFRAWKKEDEKFVKATLVKKIVGEWDRMVAGFEDVRSALRSLQNIHLDYQRVIAAECPISLDSIGAGLLDAYDVTTDGYADAVRECYRTNSEIEQMILLSLLVRKLTDAIENYRNKSTKLTSRMRAEEAKLTNDAKPFQDRANKLDEGFEKNALLAKIKAIKSNHSPEYKVARGRRESINALVEVLKSRLADVTQKFYKTRKDIARAMELATLRFGVVKSHPSMLYTALTKNDTREIFSDLLKRENDFIETNRISKTR